MTVEEATVFIVDDDASVCKALKRLIQSMGFKVIVFDSAKNFLEHGSHERPACLVLDVRMPGMSGIELQEQLRNAGVSIPIIFITGHANVSMTVEAMKAGALDFIEKPFDDQKLINAINQAIKKDKRLVSEFAVQKKLQQRVNSLTPREHEVFVLVVDGMLNKQIAFDLGMSEKTVKVHRARVMQKMKARSLADLVRMSEKLAGYGTDIQSL